MSANRGKYAEGKVRDFLKQYAAEHRGFCYNRILDAHSARGAMANPQPGDFQWFMRTDIEITYRHPGVIRDSLVAQSLIANGLKVDSVTINEGPRPFTRNGLIEIKEVEHEYRLPHKNFSPDQVGRMRIRQMAGSEPLVLVCHRPKEGRTTWRSPEFEYFQQRDGGSWDLRDFDEFEYCSDILKEHLK